MRRTSIALGFALLLSGVARNVAAQEAEGVTLKVGDPAPALSNGKWIKGEPVKAFEPGKVYVLECWATWCGPCVAAIPHVTELQHTYAKDGLVVIGQNVWERDAKLPEPFVAKMGDKMDYRVVMDDEKEGNPGSGQMATTWLKAAGRNGIPCSFVIDRAGKIAWIGHPMQMEPILKEVLAGTFDPKKAAADAAVTEKFNKSMTEALQKKDYDGALALLDAYSKDHPDAAPRLDVIRFNLLFEKGDFENAYKTAGKVVETSKDVGGLNVIAWRIVDAKDPKARDLDLALKAAQRADELSEHKVPPVLDTLARVYFEKGDQAKAIETETKAVEFAEGKMKAALQKTLDKYQAPPAAAK